MRPLPTIASAIDPLRTCGPCGASALGLAAAALTERRSTVRPCGQQGDRAQDDDQHTDNHRPDLKWWQDDDDWRDRQASLGVDREGAGHGDCQCETGDEPRDAAADREP